MRVLGSILLLLLLLAGCVVFVTPETYGSECRFTGETSQCGACVAAQCRAEIDQCCGDERCEETMRSLDGCAERRDGACVELASSDTNLGRCVARACGAVCQPLTGVSRTTCREPRLGEGAVCTCESSLQTSNDHVCSTAAYPETLCCAPKGWPAAGLACSCRALECTPTADGCFCRLVDFAPKSRACSAAHCCKDPDGNACTCGAEPCKGFQTEVPSCEIAEMACAEGQERRDACSARISE
jgi:hypothetical protein